MGHDQFAGNVLEIMLSWFRALMNGVWSLFTGSSGGSLLSWLSGSWKSLLVVLLTIGVVTDVIVYLLRWRPFWWWFRKKRMVVDDAILEPNEPLPSARRPAPARRGFRAGRATFAGNRKKKAGTICSWSRLCLM